MTLEGQLENRMPARRQRRAAGHARRIATLFAAFALTLTGLAAPAWAAVHLEVAVFPANYEVPTGHTQEVNVSVDAGTDIDAETVRVVTTLPAGVTYAGVGTSSPGRAPAGPCEAAGPTITCTVTDATAIEERKYLYPFLMRFTGAAGTRLPISATVTGSGADGTSDTDTEQGTVRIVEVIDFGLEVRDVSGPSGPDNVVTYTYVIRNNGRQSYDHAFGESGEPFDLGTEGFTPRTVTCFQEAEAAMHCALNHRLAPGQELRVTRSLPVPADSPLWGNKVTITGSVVDVPTVAGNPGNNVVTFELDFTGKPGTVSPAPPGTAAPGTGDDGGEGGSLPITGSATVPVVATGIALLLAGLSAVALGRRRRA